MTLNGVPAFNFMTCWIGGDGILTSETLNGPLAFSEMTCCIGAVGTGISMTL